MSMDYIRRTYAVPAKRGALVRPKVGPAKGQLGRVLRALDSGRLTVRDNGPQRLQVWWGVYHPTDLHYVTTDKQRGSDGESVPDAEVRGEPAYDRELIAGMLDVLSHIQGVAYTTKALNEQAELLRAADNADAAGVRTVANPSACELGAVRELAKAWRARADACVDDFNSGVSTREVTVMRDLADELEAALQQRGDSPEVGRG